MTGWKPLEANVKPVLAYCKTCGGRELVNPKLKIRVVEACSECQ